MRVDGELIMTSPKKKDASGGRPGRKRRQASTGAAAAGTSSAYNSESYPFVGAWNQLVYDRNYTSHARRWNETNGTFVDITFPNLTARGPVCYATSCSDDAVQFSLHKVLEYWPSLICTL